MQLNKPDSEELLDWWRKFRRYPSNLLINLLGQWQDTEGMGQTHSVPVGGLAYYVSPPSSLAEIISDPFHALFYLTFVLTACALFSKTWIEVLSHSSNRNCTLVLLFCAPC